MAEVNSYYLFIALGSGLLFNVRRAKEDSCLAIEDFLFKFSTGHFTTSESIMITNLAVLSR